MKIDGRQISEEILAGLRIRVNQLKKARGITPHLAVVLVGNNPASLTYIRQKQKAAEKIGALFSLHHFPKTPTPEKITLYIQKLAAKPDIHGLITQRPIPEPLSTDNLTRLVPSAKDVDGFLANSPFDPPVALAVIKILKSIYSSSDQPAFAFAKRWPAGARILPQEKQKDSSHLRSNNNTINDFSPDFLAWLRQQYIVIIGRGETAGKPIAQLFTKHSLPFEVIHSQTENRVELLKKADIIISSVGKSGVIKAGDIKKGIILIGIGLHSENGKLIGDYNENDIDSKTLYYTPTPKGTGPVNVASLMQNVVQACELSLQKVYK